jgi:ubiquitin-conjugating enzyme E2 Q
MSSTSKSADPAAPYSNIPRQLLPPYPPPALVFLEVSKAPQMLNAKYDSKNGELILPKDMEKIPLQAGDWVCIFVKGRSGDARHCKVQGILWPVVRLGPGIDTDMLSNATPVRYPCHGAQAIIPITTPPLAPALIYAKGLTDVEFLVYDQNFDDLSDQDKRSSICILLSTLPSVTEMREFLKRQGQDHQQLRLWTDRLTASALGVLRWIIASNRSCLVQIDGFDGTRDATEERVFGMPGYIQFRFAQGAPDKEQRFVQAVQETQQRLRLRYPTTFAFHGSPLRNWHSIVREGLHFRGTAHGRSFGDGVYLSHQAVISLGYSAFGNYSGQTSFLSWPQSHLQVKNVLCLNEVVNAPAEYVSRTPHLVVAQLDWIQTRYLFVGCENGGRFELSNNVPQEPLPQDPNMQPTGPQSDRLVIPITAISSARRPRAVKGVANKRKKSKVLAGDSDAPYVSEDTDEEDLLLFAGPDGRADARRQAKAVAKTDFVPDMLDHSTLPLIAAPPYATSQATRALQRELQATIKVQETEPIYELGWYVNPELVENVYQWIVELHSFDESHPLSKDMKKKDVRSIVLELRFGKQFPYTPPFVRVIRPRFLPFMLGGGGHVTAGGALCMELLTNSGWNPAGSIEGVLLQVRMAITEMDPPARLEDGPVSDYGIGEAMEAFRRACITHGWEIPADFNTINSKPMRLGAGI